MISDRSVAPRRTWLLIVAVGLLPVVVSMVRFLRPGVVLDGDEAIFAGQVADAATGGFPSTGLYSRFGWNHPGPFAFYAFAPFHWISGGATWGFFLGSAAWNAAAVVLAGWLASRRGGPALVALTVAIPCATAIAMGGVATLDPWTPNLAVALVVPLLVSLWSASDGDAVSWAVVLVVGSAAVQIHVGYGILVGILVLVAAFLAVTGTDRARRRALLRDRSVRIGVVMTIVMWVPVIIDALTGRTGNIGRLWRYFRRDDPPTTGLSVGARIVAGEVSIWPSWLTGPRSVGFLGEVRRPSFLWLVLPIAGLIAARLVARRDRDRRAEDLVLVAAAGLVAAVLAASQLRGVLFDYLVFWRTPIVLFVALSLAFTLRRHVAASVRAGAAGAVLVVAVLAASLSAASADQVTRYGTEVGELVDDIAAVPEGSVLVRLADTGFVGAAPGVLRWLEREGVDAGVDPSLDWVFGDRVVDPADAAEVWYVTDTGWSLSLLSGMPGARVVAERTPLDDADETRVRELQRSLGAQLQSAGFGDDVGFLDATLVELALSEVAGIDLDALGELAEWNERTSDAAARFGIVAFDPSDAPEIPWRLTGM